MSFNAKSQLTGKEVIERDSGMQELPSHENQESPESQGMAVSK